MEAINHCTKLPVKRTDDMSCPCASPVLQNMLQSTDALAGHAVTTTHKQIVQEAAPCYTLL